MTLLLVFLVASDVEVESKCDGTLFTLNTT